MTLTLGMVTFDTSDAESLATWWAEQTGAEIVQNHEGWFVVVAGGALTVLLAFQKVDDPTPGKNRCTSTCRRPTSTERSTRLGPPARRWWGGAATRASAG